MSRSLVVGAGATLVSEAVGRGAGMAFQVVVANQLGASRFGAMAVALAAAATLSPLADAGLPNLGLQLVSGAPREDRLVGRLLGLKIALTPLFLIPLVVWAVCFPLEAHGWRPLLCAGAFYGFQASSDLLRQILRAREAIRSELVARFCFPAANLVALVGVWFLKPGPAGALVALACGPFALTVAYLVVLPRVCLVLEPFRSMVRFAGAHWVSMAQSVGYLAMVGLATRVDAFLLQDGIGSSHVGRFFAVSNLVLAGMFFGQGMASYLYPRIHRQTRGRPRALLRAYALQAALGLALAAGAIVVGPTVFRSVYRVASFRGAESMVPGFALVLLMSVLESLSFAILVGARRQWIAAVDLLPTIALKFLLGRAWIPVEGEVGMLKANLVGFACTVVLDAGFAAFHYLHGRTGGSPGRQGDEDPGAIAAAGENDGET